ncbi:MAG: ATP-grasp domain-containing protein [Pseudomonadota bacterium]|nr:ATP-grasp domain-containing protein [Pseudomonadota bacterium]
MTGAFVPVIHGAALDRPDEADTIVAAESVADSLCRLGYTTEIVVVGLDLSVLIGLAARKPHAIFNLVEALAGDAALAHLPLAVLDHLCVPYTGAGGEAWRLTLSKVVTKDILRARGLPTPDWWVAGDAAPKERRVIVKSEYEHGSVGIDSESVVSGARALGEIVARQQRFGGSFFAEKFIEGREFNVGIISGRNGPQVLPVPEILFEDFADNRPRIVDYEAKWHAGSDVYRNTPRRFGLENTEPALALRLTGLARDCWRAFGLTGYARVDFRVDASGEPKILEINPNPALAADAGFPAAAAQAGLDYDAMIARIVDAAVERARKAA